MADRGTVGLQSTSLEGNAVISIRGFVPLGMANEQPCDLAGPTQEQIDDWYGGPDSNRIFYTSQYYPVLTMGSPSSLSPQFVGGFGGEATYNLETHTQDNGITTNVREEYVYFECLAAWDAPAKVRITRPAELDSGDGFDFEIRWSTAPTTRDTDGYLYDYAGAPNYLLGDVSGITGNPGAQTFYLPTRDGELIADQDSLPVDGSVTLENVRGRAIVILSVEQSPPGGEQFTGFVLEALAS